MVSFKKVHLLFQQDLNKRKRKKGICIFGGSNLQYLVLKLPSQVHLNLSRISTVEVYCPDVWRYGAQAKVHGIWKAPCTYPMLDAPALLLAQIVYTALEQGSTATCPSIAGYTAYTQPTGVCPPKKLRLEMPPTVNQTTSCHA